MSHTWVIVFLLMSRLPIYMFVVIRAWQFRHSMVIISSKWLGCMASTAMIGALTNAFGDKIVSNVVGSIFALSLFMLVYTAKELKRIKE